MAVSSGGLTSLAHKNEGWTFQESARHAHKTQGVPYLHEFRNNKAHLHLASCVSRGVQICLPVPADRSSESFRSIYPIKTNSHPISSTTLKPFHRLCRTGCQPDLVVKMVSHAKAVCYHTFVLPGNSCFTSMTS